MKEAHGALRGRSHKQKLRRKELVKNFAEKFEEKSKIRKWFCVATGIKRKFLNEGCLSELQRKHRRDALSTETEKKCSGFL